MCHVVTIYIYGIHGFLQASGYTFCVLIKRIYQVALISVQSILLQTEFIAFIRLLPQLYRASDCLREVCLAL